MIQMCHYQNNKTTNNHKSLPTHPSTISMICQLFVSTWKSCMNLLATFFQAVSFTPGCRASHPPSSPPSPSPFASFSSSSSLQNRLVAPTTKRLQDRPLGTQRRPTRTLQKPTGRKVKKTVTHETALVATPTKRLHRKQETAWSHRQRTIDTTAVAGSIAPFRY